MSATAHNERTIKAVARNIAAKIETDLAGDYTFAIARRDNADGWAVWFPAPTGGEVVHEGVTLGDDELKRAWHLAAKSAVVANA